MEAESTGSSGREIASQPGERHGWTLFHVVRSQSPMQDDFRSMLGRRVIPRPQRNGQFDPEVLRRAAGVSCYETRDQARAAAIRHGLGRFIAELFIPEDGCAIELARTGSADGHYTVWASLAYFVSHVVSVEPV